MNDFDQFLAYCEETLGRKTNFMEHAMAMMAWKAALTTDSNGGAEIACSAGLEALAIKKQLDKLLCVVNAVTCPHRHGQPIRPKDLTRLIDKQIEVEEALRAMGY